MREFAVIEDIPQKSWAPMAISSRSLAPVSLIASVQIWQGAAVPRQGLVEVQLAADGSLSA